jgi:hypothetical protein
LQRKNGMRANPAHLFRIEEIILEKQQRHFYT